MNKMSILPIVLNLLKKSEPSKLTKEQISFWLSGFIDGKRYINTFSRLTKIEKNSITIDSELNEIIIGLLLGDLNIQGKDVKHARLRFKQGKLHANYLNHLFEIFKFYCASDKPSEYNYLDKRTNKTYTSLVFNTRYLPCFDRYYSLFYFIIIL